MRCLGIWLFIGQHSVEEQLHCIALHCIIVRYSMPTGYKGKKALAYYYHCHFGRRWLAAQCTKFSSAIDIYYCNVSTT